MFLRERRWLDCVVIKQQREGRRHVDLAQEAPH
jgi:hypothetical protein